MYKRGQFFLIAALVIISLILSLGTVSNRATKSSSDDKVQYLAEEIKEESQAIVKNERFSIILE